MELIHQIGERFDEAVTVSSPASCDTKSDSQ